MINLLKNKKFLMNKLKFLLIDLHFVESVKQFLFTAVNFNYFFDAEHGV